MVNKAILVGRLGRDPEVKYIQDGSLVTTFSVATTERKSKDGEKKEQTTWHRLVSFGKLAEICGSYLSKGSLVYVEGRIQNRSWEDKDGNKRTTTEIVASSMHILEGKKSSSGEPKRGEAPVNEEDVPF